MRLWDTTFGAFLVIERRINQRLMQAEIEARGKRCNSLMTLSVSFFYTIMRGILDLQSCIHNMLLLSL